MVPRNYRLLFLKLWSAHDVVPKCYARAEKSCMVLRYDLVFIVGVCKIDHNVEEHPDSYRR